MLCFHAIISDVYQQPKLFGRLVNFVDQTSDFRPKLFSCSVKPNIRRTFHFVIVILNC